MRSEEDFNNLCEKFCELADPSVNLSKEVYAHFGLLFYTFGLVEHTLINTAHLNRLHSKFPEIKNTEQEEWSKEWERIETIIDKLTFGYLASEVKTIAEFQDIADELDWSNQVRNYFAHNFFRKEVNKSHSDEGRKLLLVRMAKTRDRVRDLDGELSWRYSKMCMRIGLKPASDDEIEQELANDKKVADLAIDSNSVEFGWTA